MALTASERQKQYQERHPERVAAYRSSERYKKICAEKSARYRARNPEKIAAYKASEANKKSNAKYRAEHGKHPINDPQTEEYKKYRLSEKFASSYGDSHLKRKYGITYEQYKMLLAEQQGGCKICGSLNLRKSHRRVYLPLFVDHCHKTNKVRGLLCNLCNVGIANFREEIKFMENAIAYLKEHCHE